MTSPPLNSASSLPNTQLENPALLKRQRLDQLVSEVLNDGQDRLYGILPFIEWRLRSFHLEHKYEARDIFLDAYRRAAGVIHREEEIQFLPAWLKATAFNIIREYARKAGKLKVESLDHQQLANVPEVQIADQILEARLVWLLSALKQLKPEDQEILQLRLRGYSYEEISMQRGVTAATLRQKVSRLLKQLRQSASQIDV